MRNWFVVLLILLCGCSGQNKELIEVKPEEKEPVTIPEKKSLYPTLQSYMDAIVFRDGTKLTQDPNESVYYDAGAGIQSVNIAKFYRKNKGEDSLLKAKIKELGKSVWLQNLKSVAHKDPVFDFIEERRIVFGTPEGKPRDILQISNSVVQQAMANKRLLEKLSKKYKKNPDSMKPLELEQLVILREENGDYKQANQIWKKTLCKKYPKRCVKTELKINGWVQDDERNGIPQVNVEVLNDPKLDPFKTNEFGDYGFTVEVRPYQLVRVRYSARGYMPLIKEIRIGPRKELYEVEAQVRLPQVHKVSEIQAGKAGRIDTGLGTAYEYKANTFQRLDGTVYKGKAKGYFFDFYPGTNDMGEVLNGALRVVGGVVPEMGLSSLGMAYAVFETESGEPLRILQKNPLTVVTNVTDPGYFYRGFRWEGASEEEFWDTWMAYSKKAKGIYGSTLAMESEPHFFTSYWVYNIDTGIWEEVPFHIIAPGVIQSVLYTHSKE